MRDNVAANGVNHHQDIVNGSGFNFTWPAASSANTRIPLFRGADVTVSGEYRLVNMQHVPIPEFRGNEAYGAMPTGIVIWQLGTDGYQIPPAMGETIVRDFTGWHLHESAFFGYPAHNITFDGLVVRGHRRARGTFEGGTGWWSGDYKNRNVTIRNADVQGMSGGLDVSTATEGVVVIEDSYFSNWYSNISVDTLATPGTQATPAPRTTIVRNTRFDPMPGAPSFWTIRMNWTTHRGNSHTQTSDRLFVYGHDGIAGSDFRVFYAEQASQNIAGGTATCTGTRPDVDGLVCPITTHAPMPGALSPTSGSASGGTVVTLTGASFASGARVEFGGLPATNVTVSSATRITATAPAHNDGTVNVSVTNSEGQRGVLFDAFTFGNGTAPCTYSLDSPAATVAASGGSRSVSVSAGPGCDWSASTSVPWVTVTAGASGSGNWHRAVHDCRQHGERGAIRHALHRGADVHRQPGRTGMQLQRCADIPHGWNRCHQRDGEREHDERL